MDAVTYALSKKYTDEQVAGVDGGGSGGTSEGGIYLPFSSGGDNTTGVSASCKGQTYQMFSDATILGMMFGGHVVSTGLYGVVIFRQINGNQIDEVLFKQDNLTFAFNGFATKWIMFPEITLHEGENIAFCNYSYHDGDTDIFHGWYNDDGFLRGFPGAFINDVRLVSSNPVAGETYDTGSAQYICGTILKL